MEKMLVSLAVVLFGYGGVVSIIGLMQRHLIYFPVSQTEENSLEHARDIGLEPWLDEDQNLIGWKQAHGAPNRMLVFHGNAGYAQMRAHYGQSANLGLESPRWDFYLFEYPGYGPRPGTPGEELFIKEAKAAVEQLVKEDDRPLVLLGESIGGGVAAPMAARFSKDIAGLLLVTPFTSLPEVGAYHYPYLPVRTLLRESYDVRGALGDFSGPVGFVMAGQDEIIPTKIGRSLYEAYEGRKNQWIQEGATHNTLDLFAHPRFWREFEDFVFSGE